MRRLLVPGLLALSLVFNLCFIAGYLYVRNLVGALNSPEGRVELIGRRMGVDERTREQCIAIERSRIAERQRIKDSEAGGIAAFYEECVKDAPDMDRLRAMVDAGMGLHRRFLHNDLEHFMRIAALLTPQQRRTMANIFRDEDLFAE